MDVRVCFLAKRYILREDQESLEASSRMIRSMYASVVLQVNCRNKIQKASLPATAFTHIHPHGIHTLRYIRSSQSVVLNEPQGAGPLAARDLTPHVVHN